MRNLSVVVCTRDRRESLARCVDAMLKVESSEEWELVIVDNGSQDGTADFLRSLPSSWKNVSIITVFESRLGLGIARNTGWRRASAGLVAFTDDDCYVAPDYVSNVIRAFGEDEGLSFIGGRILLHDPNDLRLTIMEDSKPIAFAPRSFIPAGAVHGANMAFHKSVLERIGGFDENFGPGAKFVCDDIDALAAALWAGFRGAYDPRPTVYHHHGRRTAQEAQALFRIYDRGRGAYFAKYIFFNKESRYEYLGAWISGLKRELRYSVTALRRGERPPAGQMQKAGEIRAAVRYALFRCVAAVHRRGRFIRPNRDSSSNTRNRRA
jgi:glycosyltransferase involved in cell wall biosynthesis